MSKRITLKYEPGDLAYVVGHPQRRRKCRTCNGGGSLRPVIGPLLGVECPNCKGKGRASYPVPTVEKVKVIRAGAAVSRTPDGNEVRIDYTLQTLIGGKMSCRRQDRVYKTKVLAEKALEKAKEAKCPSQ